MVGTENFLTDFENVSVLDRFIQFWTNPKINQIITQQRIKNGWDRETIHLGWSWALHNDGSKDLKENMEKQL